MLEKPVEIMMWVWESFFQLREVGMTFRGATQSRYAVWLIFIILGIWLFFWVNMLYHEAT